jgi:hypothetical protein
MTDRQARKLIYAVIEANKNRFNDDTLEALEMGRKALEQPTVDVLEQIRAEIERLHHHPKLDFIKNDEVVEMALDIIDRHRESEVRNEKG